MKLLRNKIFIGALAMTAFMPSLAFAQQATAGSILATISLFLNSLIPVLITLATVYVIWGIIRYATGKSDDKQTEGRGIIINGIVALFIIVSLWGLVGILNSTFGINQTAGPAGSVFDPNAPGVVQSNQNSVCDGDVKNLSDVFLLGYCIIRTAVVPLLVALSAVVFIAGVIRYFLGANDSTKRQEGKSFMIYGLIALFVITSVWSLVGIISGTFGLSGLPIIPQLPTI